MIQRPRHIISSGTEYELFYRDGPAPDLPYYDAYYCMNILVQIGLYRWAMSDSFKQRLRKGDLTKIFDHLPVMISTIRVSETVYQAIEYRREIKDVWTDSRMYEFATCLDLAWGIEWMIAKWRPNMDKDFLKEIVQSDPKDDMFDFFGQGYNMTEAFNLYRKEGVPTWKVYNRSASSSNQ